MNYERNNFLCRKCTLWNKCQSPHIEGRGNINSSILILGETPGKTEDEEGVPFVGSSGNILNHYLNLYQIDCYIDNIIRCRPSTPLGENKTPTAKEIECCKPFTTELILKMKPKVILAVGSIALKQLVKVGASMEVIRGKEFYSNDFNCIIVPTYHPSYLLRTRDKQGNKDRLLYKNFEEDVALVKQIALRPEVRKIKSKPRTLSDPIDIKNYLTNLLEVPEFSFDLETTGLNHRNDRITDISFCHELGKGVHIKWSNILEFEPLLKRVMETSAIKIAHNASFDMGFLQQVGYTINGVWFDTMLAYHTLNMSAEGGSNNAIMALDTLSWILTTEGGYKGILEKYGGIAGYINKDEPLLNSDEEQLIQGTLFEDNPNDIVDKEIQTDYDKYLVFFRDYQKEVKSNLLLEHNLDALQYYSAMDSDVTYRIYKNLQYKIQQNYSFVFYEIIMPLCRVLTNIKLNGIKLDYEYMDKVKNQNEKEIEIIKSKFFKKIGYEFNINSSKEIMNLMYNVLGLIPESKFVTKKGKKPAADDEAIKYYSKQKPVLKYIQDYRGLAKETATYLVGFKEKSDSITHRIYPDYFQLTATGRSSCFLHTVPRDNKIRNMIIPSKNSKIIIADLSQIELRMMALLSNDSNMITAFASGHDFHTYTACAMFNIDINKFDKKNPEHDKARTNAKAINFGIIFGLQAYSLAQDLGITQEVAQSFIDRFFASYPMVRVFIDQTVVDAHRFGYVDTLYGRRRYLPKIYSSDTFKKGEAERRAVNTRIQGSAADITNLALIRFQTWLETHHRKSLLIGTIHDSILVECPDEEIELTSQKLIDCMTKDMPRMPIPLKADLDILDKWRK